ncbi:MAG: dephospho-CoA kinase [Rhodocyclaceae bacterium]|nr:dephospho-CoA kinase [Rhodocyclaceae bacterium]MDZ4214253.1 dephospho-CoA kinase [Rhodocyclaceae bacterium]
MVWVLGLTGGIGSGKSAVAERFARHGAAIVDTDEIAHALTAPGGAALPALQAGFGAAIMTKEGALDRAALRRMVFADPAARARLEAILHPMIHREVAMQLSRLVSADFCYGVLVVPLLVETGAYRNQIQRTLVVDCPPELQIARVMARSGLTQAEVEAILAVQASRQQRLACADDVVHNDDGLVVLDAAVAALHDKYMALAIHQKAEADE